VKSKIYEALLTHFLAFDLFNTQYVYRKQFPALFMHILWYSERSSWISGPVG